jgi:hypothetical protein
MARSICPHAAAACVKRHDAGTPAPAPLAGCAWNGTAKPDGMPRVRGEDLRVDHRPRRAASTNSLGDIQFSLRNVTRRGRADAAATGVQLTPQGTVRLDGTVSITFVKADLGRHRVVRPPPTESYIEQHANARLTQGALTAGLIYRGLDARSWPLAATVIGGMKLKIRWWMTAQELPLR